MWTIPCEKVQARRQWIAEAILLAIVYAVVGKLGLLADAVSGFATLLWLPSGLALAALLLRGGRLWPGIALGAFLANTWSGAHFATACAIAVGNTLEGVLGAAALRRLGFLTALDRVKDILALVVAAAFLTTMVSSTIGVASLYLAGLVHPDSLALTWRAWWFGDMASELIVTPMLLTLGTHHVTAVRSGRILESAGLALSIVLAWLAVFALPLRVTALPYLLFPPLIWAALRFDQRAVTAATLLVAVAATLGTALGLGPFAAGVLHVRLMSLQLFLIVIAVTSLLLGAVVQERTRAARECRDGDERLRLAQRAARIGAFDWNVQTGVNVWTSELEAMHGLEAGAFPRTERAWEDLLHPEDREEAVRRVKLAIATGAPTEGEWRVRWPDGSVHWIAARWRVFKDESGRPLRMTGVHIEITERKRAAETQERLASIVESTDDAIIAKDLDGLVRTWNPGAQRMFGYSPEEVVGRSIRMLLPPDRKNEEDDMLARLRRGERIQPVETVRVAKDGHRVDVSVTVSPLHDPSGNVVGASKIARDITDRKRVEEALREADRRKDEFLAILSHELRNPLAPIRNAVYILQRARASTEATQRAQAVIARQVTHLARLIDDLLDVTRIARGRITLHRTHVNLTEIVRASAEDHRAILEGRELSLSVTNPPEPVWIDGDATRLSQILGNLLQNAAKFATPGSTVDLGLVRSAGWAEIHVRDRGIGIEPDVLPTLFQPFVQAQKTLARSDGGLGLGLALVKGLAELHGGSVRASSSGPGQGSEFVVRLPATASERSAERTAAAPGAAPHRRARVLVVEDDHDVADSMVELVEFLGYDVELARDGPTAIARAHSAPPDVLLCDIGLPGMSGYEVARAFRSDPELQRTRLVAVSGYALDDDRAEAAEAGFECHLAKPADPDDIQRVLL